MTAAIQREQVLVRTYPLRTYLSLHNSTTKNKHHAITTSDPHNEKGKQQVSNILQKSLLTEAKHCKITDIYQILELQLSPITPHSQFLYFKLILNLLDIQQDSLDELPALING